MSTGSAPPPSRRPASAQPTGLLSWLFIALLIGVLSGAWFFRQTELFVTALVLMVLVIAGESFLPWRKARKRRNLLEGRTSTPILTLVAIGILVVVALLVFPPAILIPLFIFLRTRGLPGDLRWETGTQDGKILLGARKTLGLLPVYQTHAVPTGIGGVMGPVLLTGSPVGHLSSAWCEYTLLSEKGDTLLRIPSVEAFRVNGPDGSILVDVRGARIDTSPTELRVPDSLDLDLSAYTLRDLYKFTGYLVDDTDEGDEYYDEAAGASLVYGQRPKRRIGFADILFFSVLVPMLLVPVVGWFCAAVWWWVRYFSGGRVVRQIPLDVPLCELLSGTVHVRHRHIAAGETVSAYGPVDAVDDGEHLLRSDTRDVLLVKSGQHRCVRTLPRGMFVFLLPATAGLLLALLTRVISVIKYIHAFIVGSDGPAWSTPLWWWAVPAALFLLLGARYVMRVYNALVRIVNHVEYTWSLIEVALEKRAVLLAQLTSVVERALTHEKSTLLQATEARWLSAASAADQGPNVRTGNLTLAPSDIVALIEAYPVLRGDQAVAQLFDTIVSVENFIQGTRETYNEAVAHVRTVFGMIPYRALSGLFNKRRESFWEL